MIEETDNQGELKTGENFSSTEEATTDLEESAPSMTLAAADVGEE